MRKFDWSIIFPLMGGIVLILGKSMRIEPILLVSVVAALLFAMFLVAAVRFFKLRELETRETTVDLAAEDSKSAQEKNLPDEVAKKIKVSALEIKDCAAQLLEGKLDFTTEAEYICLINEQAAKIDELISK